MLVRKCIVCGYTYHPEHGDPKKSIETDTPFEDLPDDWHCPTCCAGKDSCLITEE